MFTVLKFAISLVVAMLSGAPSGMFLYVIASIVYGLWKRMGGCLVFFALPLGFLGIPFFALIMPNNGQAGIMLGFFTLLNIAYDIYDINRVVQYYNMCKKAI